VSSPLSRGGRIAVVARVGELGLGLGDGNCLLKIVCRGIADYDRIYKHMIRAAKLSDVSSSFAMEQIKYTTEVPL
jgi:Lrp/AsnC family transcriptional regulator